MKLYELITEYKTDKDPRLSNLSTSIDPTKIPDYFKKYIRDYFENGRGVYRGIIGHKPLLKGKYRENGS